MVAGLSDRPLAGTLAIRRLLMQPHSRFRNATVISTLNTAAVAHTFPVLRTCTIQLETLA